MFSKLSRPRTYVKYATSCLYYGACTAATTAALNVAFDPETESAEDNVETAGLVVGAIIWWQTESRVTSVIDKMADWRIARKEAKKQEEVTA